MVADTFICRRRGSTDYLNGSVAIDANYSNSFERSAA